MVQLRPEVSIEEMFTKKRSVLEKKKTLGSECQRACGSSEDREVGHQSQASFEATASCALARERTGCAGKTARAPEARTRAKLPGL